MTSDKVNGVKYFADSPDDLRTKIDVEAGDRARVSFRGREITMVAVDRGPLGLVWEELREDSA